MGWRVVSIIKSARVCEVVISVLAIALSALPAQADVDLPLSDTTYCHLRNADDLNRRAALVRVNRRGVAINLTQKLRRRKNRALKDGRPVKAARILAKLRSFQQSCRERQLTLMSCTSSLGLGVEACVNSGYLLPQEECLDSGGNFGLGFFVGVQFCNPPADDAGSSCQSSSECESVCVAPSDSTPGATVTGSCHDAKHAIGICVSLVEGGIAQNIICFE